MSSDLKHTFRIRRVSKGNDHEYLEGLKIYNETTPYEIKQIQMKLLIGFQIKLKQGVLRYSYLFSILTTRLLVYQ